jgi:signal transduction histidine kinase
VSLTEEPEFEMPVAKVLAARYSEEKIKLHQPIALQKGLEFTYFVDPKIPKTLIGDSGRIYRILLELLSNAFRFTKQGKVDILIKLAKKSDRHLVIQCAVKDTGRGFPKEKQEELFMRFKKLIPSHEPTFMGAGLGLAIVKQLMSDLDGEIHVESPIHDNQGAQFICLIPVTEPLLSDVNVSIM